MVRVRVYFCGDWHRRPLFKVSFSERVSCLQVCMRMVRVKKLSKLASDYLHHRHTEDSRSNGQYVSLVLYKSVTRYPKKNEKNVVHPTCASGNNTRYVFLLFGSVWLRISYVPTHSFKYDKYWRRTAPSYVDVIIVLKAGGQVAHNRSYPRRALRQVQRVE
jgi:hypothetical protein